MKKLKFISCFLIALPAVYRIYANYTNQYVSTPQHIAMILYGFFIFGLYIYLKKRIRSEQRD